MNKICIRCGLLKPIVEDYYKHAQMKDGHLSVCKSCVKDRVGKREKALRETTEFVVSERERGREKYHRLYKGNGQTGSTEAKAKYIKDNPLRRYANNMVASALKSGRLEKKPCEVCDDPRVHGHHDDYYKPLEVRWLCTKHHHEHHVKLREEELLNK